MKNIKPFLFLIIITLLIYELIVPIVPYKNAYDIENVIDNSVSAQEAIPSIYEKSIENVSLIYPDIRKHIGDIQILLFDGEFINIDDGSYSNGYFNANIPVIVLDRSLDSVKLERTLTHELLHYVDLLKGNGDDIFWSMNFNVNCIIDTNISSYDNSFEKLFYIFTNNKYTKNIGEKMKDNINYINVTNFLRIDILSYNTKRDYYISPKEIFVRVNLLKIKMFELGLITKKDLKDLKSGINKENIKCLIANSRIEDHDDHSVMYFIDWGYEYNNNNKNCENDK